MATLRLVGAAPAPDPFVELSTSLSRLADQAISLPEAGHEQLGIRELEPVLLEAQQLVRSAASAFAALAERLRRAPPTPPACPVDPGQLAGLAHLARFTLSGRRAEIERVLGRLGRGDDEAVRWDAIQAAHGGAGDVLRAVTGVDVGLSALARSRPGPTHFERAAELAFAIRRALTTFRAELGEHALGPGEDTGSARARIGRAMHALASSSVYPWIRVEDRRSLRALARRSEGIGPTPREAALRSLHEGARSLAEVALQMNERHELRALDRHLVDHAAVALVRDLPASPFLALLEGRDPALDAAARAGDPHALLRQLERVRRALDIDPTLLFRSHLALERLTRKLLSEG